MKCRNSTAKKKNQEEWKKNEGKEKVFFFLLNELKID